MPDTSNHDAELEAAAVIEPPPSQLTRTELAKMHAHLSSLDHMRFSNNVRDLHNVDSK